MWWFKILVELLIKMHCLLTLFTALFPTTLPLIPHAWNRCIHTRGKHKTYVYVVLFPVTIEIGWWSPNKAMSNSKLTLMGFTTTVPRSCLFVSYELTLGDIAKLSQLLLLFRLIKLYRFHEIKVQFPFIPIWTLNYITYMKRDTSLLMPFQRFKIISQIQS